MKILVCGSRNYSNSSTLFNILRTFPYGTIDCIVQGEAKGADLFAKEWAATNSIPTRDYRAHWDQYGKAAGFRRNELMLRDNPDIEAVVAFFNTETLAKSRGTAMMCQLSANAGKSVYVFDDFGILTADYADTRKLERVR